MDPSSVEFFKLQEMVIYGYNLSQVSISITFCKISSKLHEFFGMKITQELYSELFSLTSGEKAQLKNVYREFALQITITQYLKVPK